MKPLYVGIDPGLSGAFAVLNPETGRVVAYDCPTVQTVTAGGKKQTRWDAAAMDQIVRCLVLSGQVERAMLEAPLFFAGQGATRMGTTGIGWGLWVGLLTAHKVPVLTVHPSTWKATMFKGTGLQVPAGFVPSFVDEDERKRLVGVKKKLLKTNARTLAAEQFPADAKQFQLVKHDGRAEAALLAKYGLLLATQAFLKGGGCGDGGG